MEQDALGYLVDLGYEMEPLVETDKGLFSKKRLERVLRPTAETLQVSTLTSIVDYIKADIDSVPGKYLIQVVSPKEVKVLTPLNEDEVREEIINARAMLPDNIRYDQFLSTEKFNIMLQSGFSDIGDKALVLKFTGLIRDEAVQETGDDGISQKVTIKTGITTVGGAQVPNPVTLAPYRTFQEIDQVESKFIFRMKEGPHAAIFEADGGAWKNKAMRRIKEFLEKELEELDYVKVIS